MKSLIISIVLITLIISTVIINTFLIGKLFSEISDLLLMLPTNKHDIDNMTNEQREDYSKTLQEIHFLWNKKKNFLNLSINYEDTYKFTSNMTKAKSFFETENYPLYLAFILGAKEIFFHISESESFSPKNIL